MMHRKFFPSITLGTVAILMLNIDILAQPFSKTQGLSGLKKSTQVLIPFQYKNYIKVAGLRYIYVSNRSEKPSKISISRNIFLNQKRHSSFEIKNESGKLVKRESLRNFFINQKRHMF